MINILIISFVLSCSNGDNIPVTHEFRDYTFALDALTDIEASDACSTKAHGIECCRTKLRTGHRKVKKQGTDQ